MVRWQQRTAFTLVELLIVIAIIALLLALLMPALRSARQSAYTARCAHNIRQIGVANLLYMADYNGSIFPVTWPDHVLGNPNCWFEGLASTNTPYLTGVFDWAWQRANPSEYCLKKTQVDFVYHCPAASFATSGVTCANNKPDMVHPAHAGNISYMINGRISGWNIAAIKRPGQKLLATEKGNGGCNDCCRMHQDPGATFVNQSVPHLVRGARHNGRSNVVFLDGHVELVGLDVLTNNVASNYLWWE